MDFDVNTASWSIFISVTLQAAVHLGKDYTENLRSNKNQPLKSVRQFFEVTERLITDQTETSGRQQPMWRETTQSCSVCNCQNLRLFWLSAMSEWFVCVWFVWLECVCGCGSSVVCGVWSVWSVLCVSSCGVCLVVWRLSGGVECVFGFCAWLVYVCMCVCVFLWFFFGDSFSKFYWKALTSLSTHIIIATFRVARSTWQTRKLWCRDRPKRQRHAARPRPPPPPSPEKKRKKKRKKG